MFQDAVVFEYAAHMFGAGKTQEQDFAFADDFGDRAGNGRAFRAQPRYRLRREIERLSAFYK